MHILQSGLELIKEFVSFMKMMYGLFQFSFNDPVLEDYLGLASYQLLCSDTVNCAKCAVHVPGCKALLSGYSSV